MVRKDRDRSIIGKVFQSFTSIRPFPYDRKSVKLRGHKLVHWRQASWTSSGWYFYRRSLFIILIQSLLAFLGYPQALCVLHQHPSTDYFLFVHLLSLYILCCKTLI